MNIAYRGGSLWTCVSMSRCGVQQTGENGNPVEAFAIRPSTDPAYDVEYFVGTLTASSPAAAVFTPRASSH